MSIDTLALNSELVNDPAGLGYTQYIPNGETGKLQALINKPQFPSVKTYMVTARGIMAGYGLGPSIGAGFLDKLSAMSASVPAIKWAIKFLELEAGIDVGEAATQAMLDSLVGVNGITQAEVNGIKAMAVQQVSRAEVLGVAYIDEQTIIEALYG